MSSAPIKPFPRNPTSRTAMFLIGCCVSAALGAERIDRGAAVFPTKDGHVYIGWRLLADDPADVAFDVYRREPAGGAERKLNAAPITDSTNFVDRTTKLGAGRHVYSVEVVGKSARTPDIDLAGIEERAEIGGMRRIKLQGQYKAQRVGLGDLDGDGKLDLLVKQPDFNSDPNVTGKGYWKPSPEPYKLEAYNHDGTLMWRYDMGPGIETGTWYSPVLVYDIDGDGKAEVYCKAGPVDPAEIVRHPDGRVVGGPEFLVKLDGGTGRELTRIDWPNREGFKHLKGRGEKGEYAMFSRNYLGVAYLDGKRPHLVIQRGGTYSPMKISAYDPRLELVWSFQAKGEYTAYIGQATHGLQIADIDDDGRDEIIFGAAAIDHDGTPLWTTARGHPDVCYVGKINPALPGLQVFYGHEWSRNRDGVCLVDARTGKTLWSYTGPTTHVHSNGMVADIDPSRPGMECYGGEAKGTQFWLYDASGNRIGDKPMGGLAPRALWWGDGPTKLVVAGGKIFRFRPRTEAEISALNEVTLHASASDVVRGFTRAAGPAKIAATEVWSGYVDDVLGKVEGTVVGIADCMGDWREELIVSLPGEIRIYSTTIPASSRRTCLMQNRQYRTSVARQTMGYFYPPILGRPW